VEVFIIVLVSIIGGIAGGMGMGGGTLLIPLLTVFSSTSQHLAQSMNLLAFIPMSLIAVILHAKNKLIKYPYLLLSVPALLSSVVGSLLAYGIDSEILRKGFGIFLATLGIIDLLIVLMKKVYK
jgi:uncharacterized membrane protein YfcA